MEWVLVSKYYLTLYIMSTLFGDLVLGNVYHITPSADTPCPREPCLTLEQFATNTRAYLTSNTSIIFLSGNHSLGQVFTIGNIVSFEIYVTENQIEPSAILCTHSIQHDLIDINIFNVQYLYVRNIMFYGCTNSYKVIDHVMVADSDYSNAIGTALNVERSSINVIWSTFVNNNVGTGRISARQRYTKGGAMVVIRSIINVSHTLFMHNTGERGGAIYAADSVVNIFRSNFIENCISCFTANIEIGSRCIGASFYCEYCNVTINSSIFRRNKARAGSSGDYSSGGALGFIESKVATQHCIFMDNRASTNGGAIYVEGCQLTSSYNIFRNNIAQNGGVFYATDAYIKDDKSNLYDNVADKNGGVMSAYHSVSDFNKSIIHYNKASGSGGGFFISGSKLYITESVLLMNCGKSGGVIATTGASILVHRCNFTNNHGDEGGVFNTAVVGYRSKRHLYISSKVSLAVRTKKSTRSIYINDSRFDNNIANYGGVFKFGTDRNTTINRCIFLYNKAWTSGGVMYTNGLDTLINMSHFISNEAHLSGVLYLKAASVELRTSVLVNNTATQGIIYTSDRSHIVVYNVNINYNEAEVGVMYIVESTGILSGNTLYSNNVGSVFLYNSNINITSFVLRSCTSVKKDNTSTNYQELEGGAFTAFQSTISFLGKCTLMENKAQIGGAIYASESTVNIYDGELNIMHNVAIEKGGGIYLYQSDLQCHSTSTLLLSGNVVTENGGGIFSSSSSIKVESRFSEPTYNGGLLKFTENEADKGGGIFLEVNAKLYIQRREWEVLLYDQPAIIFHENKANFGGAVYVDDSTNSGTCSSMSYKTTSSECFVQVMALHNNGAYHETNTDIHFIDNNANISGADLYGGLLDRCIVSPYAEVYSKNEINGDIISGISYFKKISNANLESVSSSPIGICFCEDNIPDCSLEPSTKYVKKGERFSVTLAVIDQVHHTIHSANVISSLSTTFGGLGENQLNQTINGNCSELYFEVYSPDSTEELTMYADGPCKNALASTKKLNIRFSPCQCSIGFQPKTSNSEVKQTRCECECDKRLDGYISSCDPSRHTVVRKGNVWITYLNHTNNQGYLFYQNCPLDYCYTPGTLTIINLNLPNGSDAQCSNRRSGLLCGRCKPGLSLSLGSSKCISCAARWRAILFVTLFASLVIGILLVAILLALNLTVSVGTLNGIIFYTNIVSAFDSTFLFSTDNKTGFATTIIAWFNLEAGFDVCFFDGMDAYGKSLVHLAFPIYLICLVVIIIFVSERHTKFAQLIGKSNPVATLATLLLLSYTKVLNLIITSFSFVILKYPNNSSELVWLPDASVRYLRGKHIVLFILGILILVGGIAYTLLLFFWQWLLRYQNKILFRWVRYQSLTHFLEPYHAPYNFKYRYWTGLLLFIRVLLYTISSANASRDPGINLLAVGITMVGILLLRMTSRETFINIGGLMCWKLLALLTSYFFA